MTPRVIVVGGGLAGITAALDCAEAGAEVTVLEARPRLGGAAYSFQREGLWLDNGQHVFLRCCSAYLALLDRLGSRGDTFLQPRLEIPVLAPGGRAAWLRRRSLPPPLHLLDSLLRYRHISRPERLRAILAAARLQRVDPDQPATERASFGGWLTAHGQSARTQEVLWELISRPTLNLSAADTSLAGAAFVFRTGLLDRADAGDLGWATAPLQQVHGDAAGAALKQAGARVHLARRAEAIEPLPGGGFRLEAGGETLTADGVVLAVPHARAARLAPEGALSAPESLLALGHSPILNLHLVFDRPVMPHAFAAAVDSPVQFVFDRTSSSGLGSGQCLAISVSAAEHDIDLDREALLRRYVAALAELLPAARGARLERCVITRERMATFRAEPGARALRPPARTTLDGLVLAGAWTDTGWPATMEGAVRSGHLAARQLLGPLGHARLPEAVMA